MAKRFRELPDSDSQTVLQIVDEIENVDRVAPPTVAERAERQQRDYEAERRRRERDRIAAEEFARENQERRRRAQEKAERERRAAQLRIAEEAKASMAERQRQQQATLERHRLSSLVQEWRDFRGGLQQMQAAQQRENYFNDLQATINNVTQLLSPPPEPEPPPVYDSPDQKSARMGDPNWDPSEMGKAAVRWR
jgi:hypothetical protein